MLFVRPIRGHGCPYMVKRYKYTILWLKCIIYQLFDYRKIYFFTSNKVISPQKCSHFAMQVDVKITRCFTVSSIKIT